jgi:ribose/xylose/arabinose/galactoside ABC-type transport system permease subunit
LKPNKQKISNFFIDQKLLFIIIALIIILTIKDSSFLTLKSLVSILDHQAIQGILAAGMTILLISGSFDLSVGSVLASTLRYVCFNTGRTFNRACYWGN